MQSRPTPDFAPLSNPRLGDVVTASSMGLEWHGGYPGIMEGVVPLRHPALDATRTDPCNKVEQANQAAGAAQPEDEGATMTGAEAGRRPCPAACHATFWPPGRGAPRKAGGGIASSTDRPTWPSTAIPAAYPRRAGAAASDPRPRALGGDHTATRHHGEAK
jgi:hypothetical protein